jgi:TPR repeat protein
MLEKTAKDGDARAQYETGNAYLSGNGVKKDNETASEWYLKAMAAGHEGAKEKFYTFYSKQLEKRAKNGDAEAQYQTGNGYFDGYVVKKDNNTAAKWYQLAMKQGHEAAKEKFYSFYSKLLEKEAKDGDSRAQFETGNAYLNGYQVDKDLETAAEWFLKAMNQEYEGAKEKFYSFYSKQLEKRAKNGDAEAQFQTGKFYHKGAYVNRDIETAAEWYLKAKEQGHELAKEQFYSFFSKILEKDAKDNAESMYVLGCFYMDGNQVEKNLKKGTKYLATAYQKGHEQSFEKLSSTYNKDLEKIAKKGDKRAQIALAKCYLDGIGVDKNKKKASKLLVKLKEDSVYGEEAKSLLERL